MEICRHTFPKIGVLGVFDFEVNTFDLLGYPTEKWYKLSPPSEKNELINCGDLLIRLKSLRNRVSVVQVVDIISLIQIFPKIHITNEMMSTPLVLDPIKEEFEEQITRRFKEVFYESLKKMKGNSNFRIIHRT